MDISFASRDCEEYAESGAMSLITLLIQNLEQSTLQTILSIPQSFFINPCCFFLCLGMITDKIIAPVQKGSKFFCSKHWHDYGLHFIKIRQRICWIGCYALALLIQKLLLSGRDDCIITCTNRKQKTLPHMLQHSFRKAIEGWVLFLFFFFFFPWVEINSLHCSFLWFCGIFFLLCRKQTQWWWNPLRKRKKKKKFTLRETLSSRQLRKSCKVLCGRSLSSFWSALALLSSWVSCCKRNSEGDWRLGSFSFF
jgi:hypothetical protein